MHKVIALNHIWTWVYDIWYHHVDFPIKTIMQIFIIDIKLNHSLVVNSCNRKKRSNRCHFGNKRGSVSMLLAI